MLGKLLFAAVVAGGVGYAYPLWNEHAGNTCQALERRLLTMAAPNEGEGPIMHAGHAFELAVMRQWLEPVSNGAMAAAEMKQRYPGLPPEIGCAAQYWSSMLDPRFQRTAEEALR